MKKSQNNNKGITLIALVITIIVLVILVGVTVSVTINTGLIANSKTAVSDYRKAQENEITALKKVESLTAPRVNGDPAMWKFDATTGTITGWNGTEEEVVIPNYINGVAVKNVNDENGELSFLVTKLIISEGIERIISTWSNGDFVTIQLPNSIKEIGEQIFMGCMALKSITIPGASGTTIGSGAFGACAYLSDVIIEEGVTSIGDRAFSNCNLTNVTIPSSVASIGEDAFGGNPENLKLTIKKGSTLTAESPNYPWGLEESQITFEK